MRVAVLAALAAAALGWPAAASALQPIPDTGGWGLRLQAVSGSVAIPAHGGAVLLGR
jgi:hypothetical protein